MRRQDRRAYLLAACAAAAALITVALVGDEGPGPGLRAGTHRHVPADPGARPGAGAERAPRPTGPEAPDPPGAGARRRRARRVGLAFVHAFLRYEQGHRQAAVRRALLRSATTRLARALLTRPARGSARAPEGRLLRLSLYGPFGRYVKASAQIAYPGLGEALVELSLHHRAGRWRVARVRP